MFITYHGHFESKGPIFQPVDLVTLGEAQENKCIRNPRLYASLRAQKVRGNWDFLLEGRVLSFPYFYSENIHRANAIFAQ